MRESLVEVPRGKRPPKKTRLACRCASAKVFHERLLSPPAEYLGERPLSVMVTGGSCDTTGHRRLPELPEFTGQTGDDFRDFVQTKEYREAKDRRAKVSAENKVKRKRAAAVRSGKLASMRHHPLPGDPSWK
jgi:hypothetical protein